MDRKKSRNPNETLSPDKNNLNFKFIKGDVRNFSQLAEVIKGIDIITISKEHKFVYF